MSSEPWATFKKMWNDPDPGVQTAGQMYVCLMGLIALIAVAGLVAMVVVGAMAVMA